jgi:hypothetical protein
VLEKLSGEDLERVKTYCETVNSCYEVIDPGYHRDRGTILRALCQVEKLLAKKYIMDRTETEEQFRARVQACIHLFQEGQKCMFVRVKKDPRREGEPPQQQPKQQQPPQQQPQRQPQQQPPQQPQQKEGPVCPASS